MFSIQFDKDNYIETLKDTSLDDDGAFYLVEYNDKVYNFDKITEDICKQIRLGKKTRSCDALFIKDETIYLIEFKNKKSSDLKQCKQELHEKAYDSIFTLLVTFFNSKSVAYIAEKLNLILIYNDNKVADSQKTDYSSSTSIENITKKFKSYANQKGLDEFPKKFGLDKLEKHLYNQVITVDVSDFKSTVKELIFQ